VAEAVKIQFKGNGPALIQAALQACAEQQLLLELALELGKVVTRKLGVEQLARPRGVAAQGMGCNPGNRPAKMVGQAIGSGSGKGCGDRAALD